MKLKGLILMMCVRKNLIPFSFSYQFPYLLSFPTTNQTPPYLQEIDTMYDKLYVTSNYTWPSLPIYKLPNLHKNNQNGASYVILGDYYGIVTLKLLSSSLSLLVSLVLTGSSTTHDSTSIFFVLSSCFTKLSRLDEYGEGICQTHGNKKNIYIASCSIHYV